MCFRLSKPPLVSSPLNAALVSFADPHDAPSYQRGVLWVGIDPADPTRATWTEGVRSVKGSDAIDLDGMQPAWRELYERTQEAKRAAGPFGALPRLETIP